MLLSSMMVGTLLAAHAASTSAANIDFAQLAPKDSVVVVAARDFQGMMANLRASPLGGFCDLGPIKDAIEDGLYGPLAALKEAAEEHGIDVDALFEPESLGFSLYISLDEETGQTRPYIFGCAGYGQGADAAWDALSSTVKAGRAEGRLELDSRDLRGREVTVSTKITQDDEGDEDDFAELNELTMMLGDTSALLPNMDTMFYVRSKDRILMANDLVALDDALAVLDGDGGEAVDQVEDFNRLREMLGDTDAYAALRFEPLGTLLEPVLMGPAGMIMPAVDELFGSIKGFGISLSVADDPSALGMVEIRGAVYAPGAKNGVLAVFDDAKPIDLSPPKFVPVDAISFSRANVTFKDLLPLARDVAASLPMGGQELDAMLDMYEPSIKPALDTLGPAMYQFTTVRQPIAADSASNVMAVAAGEPDKVHPLLATFGPGMGLEPRDFRGETIWSDDLQTTGLAVAGNWFLFGDPRGIEQAIRSMDGGGETIADNQLFVSAARQLGDDDVVAWGWTDLVEQFAMQREVFTILGALGGGFDEFGPDAEGGPAVIEDISAVLEEISREDVARCLGPLLWTLSSPEDGWVQRLWLLPPTGQAG